MPLTALDDIGRLLDVTCCDDDSWTSVYKARPRAVLWCRECKSRMHAKVSSAGSRFFAHDALSPHCPSLGETPQHRELKRTVAEIVRSSGSRAVIEATPSPADHGGWRADVLGVSPTGVRVAFEVQLAGMTVEEGRERTARYAADRISCVWLSTRQTTWMAELPSCHLVKEDGNLLADGGLARLRKDDQWRWEPAEPVDFRKVAQGLLYCRITTVLKGFHDQSLAGRTRYLSNANLLVSRSDADDFSRYVEDAERSREAHEANRAALYERQDRVLQHALKQALGAGFTNADIWLGVPPTSWDSSYPVALRHARGTDATAGGAVIWVGAAQQERRLWAVVCPVANKASAKLGSSWRRRGVKVFVETVKEAARVGIHLHWQRSEFAVVTPGPRV